MSISGWFIMKVLGWQAVGVGMAAKHGYDRYKSNQSERQIRNHYAPVDAWWARYGTSEQEGSNFEDKYILSLYGHDGYALRNEVLERLRSRVKSDDYYVNDLLRSGGRKSVEYTGVVAMYFASKGRAARFWACDSRFPMAGKFDLHPGLKEVIKQLLRDSGVPDVEFYCDSREEQERYLSSME